MESKEISSQILRLVQYGLKQGLLQDEDAVYCRNRLMSVLGLEDFDESASCPEEKLETPAPVLDEILNWAYENQRLESNTPVYRDLLDTELMACLMPRPSEVIQTFNHLYEKDKKAATDYYYTLSRRSNYIRTDRVKKNQMWKAKTDYGDIIITINLSKPEKDPKAIAAARNMPSAAYPKCLLCKENEGFKGNVSLPARGNHRILPLALKEEKWFMQYSPYVYYNEHCIFFKAQHEPMAVTRQSFARLLEIVTYLPHYFVGSNADLPIVGGSILSHDHFQGGCAEFPMAQAPIYQRVRMKGYEDVEAGLVDWPMSVIRLRSESKAHLVDLADKILVHWRSYSDESADILAFTENTPHNTITPIARFREGKFELDLVLRNNRTSAEHPLGIFHPHAQYHHIKKENIGLIEVMGLAILPARLKEELKQLEYYLLHPEEESKLLQDPALSVHAAWFQELKQAHPTPENVEELVRRDVGVIFSKILENAGVYKRNPVGEAAFLRFIESCNRK